MDVASARACTDAVEQCVREFGGLDVLVNVAGRHQMRRTESMTDDDWADDLAVNVSGPFYLCRAALPHLLARGGNIVNVASIAGVEGQAYSAGYCSPPSMASSASPAPSRWSTRPIACASTPYARAAC